MARIIIISDTHNQHNKIDIPDGDILIHCGDATNVGSMEEFCDFANWFGNLPHKYKIFVPGNHERFCEADPQLAQFLIEEHTNSGIHYLEDSGLNVTDLNVYGSPRTPEFCNWAYMYKRNYGWEIWNKIPENTDILITHGPPYGTLDRIPYIIGEGDPHVGCVDLLVRVEQIEPKLHVFGHIHEQYGHEKIGDTLFVNAAICDEQYRPTRPPVIVDTETWSVIL